MFCLNLSAGHWRLFSFFNPSQNYGKMVLWNRLLLESYVQFWLSECTKQSLNKLNMFSENMFNIYRLFKTSRQSTKAKCINIFLHQIPFILSRIDLYVLCIVVGFVIWVYQILTQPAHSRGCDRLNPVINYRDVGDKPVLMYVLKRYHSYFRLKFRISNYLRKSEQRVIIHW